MWNKIGTKSLSTNFVFCAFFPAGLDVFEIIRQMSGNVPELLRFSFISRIITMFMKTLKNKTILGYYFVRAFALRNVGVSVSTLSIQAHKQRGLLLNTCFTFFLSQGLRLCQFSFSTHSNVTLHFCKRPVGSHT